MTTEPLTNAFGAITDCSLIELAYFNWPLEVSALKSFSKSLIQNELSCSITLDLSVKYMTKDKLIHFLFEWNNYQFHSLKQTIKVWPPNAYDYDEQWDE